MKSNLQIQKDVMAQIKWEPLLNASEIGVSVKDGVVTLSGIVDSYSKKMAAETAAKKIAGVKAIAEDIQIGVSLPYKLTDSEIAAAAVSALKWHSSVPGERIFLKVEDGVVTLEGEVDWEYQRNEAKKTIAAIQGVRLVINLVTIKPDISPDDVERKIRDAFLRSATIDSEKVIAEVRGNRVILKGKVRSFAEKDDALAAAWAAPGIIAVENNLQIAEPDYV